MCCALCRSLRWWQVESGSESLVLPLHLCQYALPSIGLSLLCQLREYISH